VNREVDETERGNNLGISEALCADKEKTPKTGSERALAGETGIE